MKSPCATEWRFSWKKYLPPSALQGATNAHSSLRLLADWYPLQSFHSRFWWFFRSLPIKMPIPQDSFSPFPIPRFAWAPSFSALPRASCAESKARSSVWSRDFFWPLSSLPSHRQSTSVQALPLSAWPFAFTLPSSLLPPWAALQARNKSTRKNAAADKKEAVTFRQKRTKGASFIRTVPLMYVLSNADEFEVENRDFIPVFRLLWYPFVL